MKNIGAVIIAGGKNSRMGGADKALLRLDGETFLRRIVRQLDGVAEILLSVDAPDHHDEFARDHNLILVADSRPGTGPMGGLADALAACRSDALLALSCDMPLYERGVGEYLSAFLTPHIDAVVAAGRDGRVHPVCAIYAKTALPVLENCLAAGELRLTGALDRLRVATAPLAHSRYPDETLANINTPEEYARVRRLVEGPPIIAVCGIKNSGKTTLLAHLIPRLAAAGIKVGVIKHDGHDFVPDVPGTDSFRLREAGTAAVAVYSADRYMVTAGWREFDAPFLLDHFRDMDLVLWEGGKHSGYPKIEVIRKAVSDRPASDPGGRLAVCSDLPLCDAGCPVFGLEEYDGLARLVLDHVAKGA